MKVDNNLRITSLLHEITQLGYNVKFASDFEGMIRIDYTKEWDDGFYEHEHRGCPGWSADKLEKEIVKSLSTFLDEHKESK